ncbi:MAG: MoxR family ATPase [Acidobacteria bacterium]|nr:MoxR family ATPase [Acidobacteriota bacterium]
MDKKVREINEKVKKDVPLVSKLTEEMKKVIIGQEDLLDKMLIALLCDGHILIEGVPGLAKTLAVKTMAKAISSDFRRIQFTPDLLPADLIGTMVYNQKSGDFTPRKGPLFSNIILADEINRAPAKVQSALLEAMQERQVTIGDQTYKLDYPFMVLATQNPIEQEGTYPLPEAQVDRFMLKVLITYPDKEQEKEIMEIAPQIDDVKISKALKVEDIRRFRTTVNEVYVDERIKNYIVDIVFATRDPEQYNLDVRDLIAFGASPRASIFLMQAARASAFINGRGYVTPEDVKFVVYDVLRHRIIATYEAEAEEITTDQIIKQMIDTIEVP